MEAADLGNVTPSRAIERLVLVAACNNLEMFERYTARSPGVEPRDLHRFDNTVENLPVPLRYNQFIDSMGADCDAWIAFVHNDFAFLEDPREKLAQLSREHIYGVVGADLVEADAATRPGDAAGGASPALEYVIRGGVACSTDLLASGFCGEQIFDVQPARTVDCCCIMLHSSLIRGRHLRFDETFPWHLYSEELSLRARRNGDIRTFVAPIKAGHYGLGSIDAAFTSLAERLHREYGDQFASTCFNPIPAPKKNSTGGKKVSTVNPVASPAVAAAPAVLVSIVVVVRGASPQAPLALSTLFPDFQRGLAAEQYEVLLVELSSDDPLSDEFRSSLPSNFRHVLLDRGDTSSVQAANRGLQEARGRVLGVILDGPRAVTPGFMRRVLFGSRLHSISVVLTLGWELGPGVAHGGSAGDAAEHQDRVLGGIQWPSEPYRLFEVSTPESSSVDGWVAPILESPAIFMPREMWSKLGGYDERFAGCDAVTARYDLFRRACALPKAQQVLICDEATFLLRRDTASQGPLEIFAEQLKRWGDEYRAVSGKDLHLVDQRARVLLGSLRPEIAAHLVSALISPVRAQVRFDGRVRGYLAEREERPVRRLPLPARSSATVSTDAPPQVEKLAQLVQQLFSQSQFAEARSICHLVMDRYGQHSSPVLERILSQCANVQDDLKEASPRRRSGYLVTLSRAYRLMSEDEKAEASLREALVLDATNDLARFELSSMLLPGQPYLDRLADVHELLSPQIYFEIGVFQGHSMTLARPPALAFGVDPRPALSQPCSVETRIHPVTSDEFFRRNTKLRLIPRRVDFAFIDGLHEFLQVVRDFWNTERLCDTNSVVAFHDTLPLDAASSTKAHDTGYWTGDVWKIIPFLLEERPDLEVVTVKTQPSGLTLVRRLRPWNPVPLKETLARAAKYDQLDFEEFQRSWKPRMTLLENSRAALGSWLLFDADASRRVEAESAFVV